MPRVEDEVGFQNVGFNRIQFSTLFLEGDFDYRQLGYLLFSCKTAVQSVEWIPQTLPNLT